MPIMQGPLPFMNKECTLPVILESLSEKRCAASEGFGLGVGRFAGCGITQRRTGAHVSSRCIRQADLYALTRSLDIFAASTINAKKQSRTICVTFALEAE